jgi:energy-converting hydrogenase A subunit B
VEEISRAIARHGGDKAGGMMMGNILCSPDASAGVLLAACGVHIAGIPGGLIAAAAVFIGCKICHDDNWYPSTTGALLTTLVITASTYIGFSTSVWIVAMVINIVLVQGISQIHASHILGRLWLLREGKTKEGQK